jgi:hypothetical protein
VLCVALGYYEKHTLVKGLPSPKKPKTKGQYIDEINMKFLQ